MIWFYDSFFLKNFALTCRRRPSLVQPRDHLLLACDVLMEEHVHCHLDQWTKLSTQTIPSIPSSIKKSPDLEAWGQTWPCPQHPWPWQSPCARRGPSCCTAARTPSPGCASCGRCGNHIWTHMKRKLKEIMLEKNLQWSPDPVFINIVVAISSNVWAFIYNQALRTIKWTERKEDAKRMNRWGRRWNSTRREIAKDKGEM